MEKQIFKIGDVVQLKSGGPDMTIEKFAFNPSTGKNFEDKVECIWFKGEETLTRTFILDTLEKVD